MSKSTKGPKMIDYTNVYYLGLNFRITQDICFTGLSGRNCLCDWAPS